MDWQLPDIGKTKTNNILPSILEIPLGKYRGFRQCINKLVGYFRIWSKYVDKIPFPWIRNDLYIVVVLAVQCFDKRTQASGVRRLNMTKHNA